MFGRSFVLDCRIKKSQKLFGAHCGSCNRPLYVHTHNLNDNKHINSIMGAISSLFTLSIEPNKAKGTNRVYIRIIALFQCDQIGRNFSIYLMSLTKGLNLFVKKSNIAKIILYK
jgi:hypothetical protein